MNQRAVTAVVGSRCRLVLQQFIAVHTLEFLFGNRTLFLEAFTQCTGKRAAFHLPEFGHTDTGGVHLQGRTHRRHQHSLRTCFFRTSTFGLPMVWVVAISCRLIFDAHTTSLSTIVRCWIPERTKPSAHHDPTPPTPNKTTRTLAIACMPSRPMSRSVLSKIP